MHMFSSPYEMNRKHYVFVLDFNDSLLRAGLVECIAHISHISQKQIFEIKRSGCIVYITE